MFLNKLWNQFRIVRLLIEIYLSTISGNREFIFSQVKSGVIDYSKILITHQSCILTSVIISVPYPANLIILLIITIKY